MNMKYLKLRYRTYWYQRAIPKRLEAALDATGTFSQNLQTHDLAIAVKLVRDINAQWDALDSGVGVRPSLAYAQALKAVMEYPHALSDDLASSPPKDQSAIFASYAESEQIAYRVAQELLGGQQRKEEYAYSLLLTPYSLLDAHEAYRESKTSTITEHTMAIYSRAVSVYLGKREDVPLAAIT